MVGGQIKGQSDKKKRTRRVCETRMPPAATKSNYCKKSLSPTFGPAPPQGHVMSVKCEQHLDELSYCMTTRTINIALFLQADRNYGRTDGRSKY